MTYSKIANNYLFNNHSIIIYVILTDCLSLNPFLHNLNLSLNMRIFFKRDEI